MLLKSWILTAKRLIVSLWKTMRFAQHQCQPKGDHGNPKVYNFVRSMHALRACFALQKRTFCQQGLQLQSSASLLKSKILKKAFTLCATVVLAYKGNQIEYFKTMHARSACILFFWFSMCSQKSHAGGVFLLLKSTKYQEDLLRFACPMRSQATHTALSAFFAFKRPFSLLKSCYQKILTSKEGLLKSSIWFPIQARRVEQYTPFFPLQSTRAQDKS